MTRVTFLAMTPAPKVAAAATNSHDERTSSSASSSAEHVAPTATDNNNNNNGYDNRTSSRSISRLQRSLREQWNQ